MFVLKESHSNPDLNVCDNGPTKFSQHDWLAVVNYMINKQTLYLCTLTAKLFNLLITTQ